MKHDLDYMLQVMQAAKEGKTIQAFDDSGWYTINNPNWDWLNSDYRIKPEPPEPEYVPYESIEEFLQGQKEHGLYLKDKLSNDYYLPHNISSIKNYLGIYGKGYYLHFDTLYLDYIWQDGTTCGKLKQIS